MTYHDIFDEHKDANIYQRKFLLWREQWDKYTNPSIQLNWKHEKFETNNKNKIPSEKGIYAFFIEPRLSQFPSPAYLTYIGETGYESNHNLRKRFGDYLYYKKKPIRRRIYLMLNMWEDYLYFYYAKVDPNQTNLKLLEQYLLDTFTPPFSKEGYSAKIGQIIRDLE